MILLSVSVILSSVVDVIHADLLKGLYCGTQSCYEVLNIERSKFTKSALGRAYRKLAAQYHPDKVVGSKKKEAEKKFHLIATAYETLKDDDTRVDYDHYLDHPEQRAYNYYQYYRRRVAPKVDARIFLSATQKYSEALDYAVKQERYRNAAKEIAKERGISLEGRFRDKKSKKEYTEQVLRKIIEENVDIRGGYKKPSIYNTLLWTLVTLPYTIYRYIIWKYSLLMNYYIKNQEYDDDVKTYLIRTNLGLSEEQFAGLDDDEKASFVENELWDMNKFFAWKVAKEEEQKRKQRERLAVSGRYKRYRRLMKSETGSTVSFVE
ncbi:unnamed protein product [Thelazia callipaeda]|uniref:J domain-containing protein n=1 Tax=Thelazia callipaeda TaxID=103827 RepID=A0A0N5D2Y9_THECL|nr:unnamed protein product [Thelazia callipaeda]